MTRTQLQEMSDRELVDFAFKRGDQLNLAVRTRRDLIHELACRLDDRYPFNPEPTPETET